MFSRPIIFLTAALLTGCTGSHRAAGRAEGSAPLARVMAGDLLVVHGEPVRLLNAQAPSLPPAAHCWAEAALAVQAASLTERLIGEAHKIDLTREGRDAQGRTLARVSLDDRRDLGEALIFAGVASTPGPRALDWCGPPDFHAVEGPGLDTGPKANAAFMGWLDAEHARRTDQTVMRLLTQPSPLEPADGF